MASNSVKPLPLVSFEAILSEPLLPIPWLVEPLIANENRVIVYGEWGACKSWLLLDLGLHIAAGKAWLGKFPVPKAKRVLYVDEEMSERTLRRRIKRLAEGAGLGEAALPFRTLSGFGLRFNAEGPKSLLAALLSGDFDADVMIVESFRRILVGSELEAADVADFWRNVKPIVKTGKTLIVSHHMRKYRQDGSNSVRDRASGSTDIMAGADTAFAVHRQSGDAVIVEQPKSRDAEEAESFVVTLYDERKDGPVILQYEGPSSATTQKATEQDRAISLIWKFLSARDGRTAMAHQIDEYLGGDGISERTGQRARKAMRQSCRLNSLGGGRWQLPEDATS